MVLLFLRCRPKRPFVAVAEPGSCARGVVAASDPGSDPKLAQNRLCLGPRPVQIGTQRSATSNNKKPATRDERLEARDQRPAAIDQKPATSDQIPTTRYQYVMSAEAAVALKSADLTTRLCERNRVRNGGVEWRVVRVM